MKLENFKRRYQKHVCQLIILETNQRKISSFMRLFWEEQQKHLQSSENNATYHATLILMLHIRQSICLVLTNILSTSFQHYIWRNQHETVYTILAKVDTLYACGTSICSYFGITILIFFMKVENAVCLNMLLKLLNEHIKLTHYLKTNIRPASQWLSFVSNVLLAYGPPEAAETARFCLLMMDCLFLKSWTFEIPSLMNLNKN